MKLWQAFALIALQAAIVLAAMTSVEDAHQKLLPMEAVPDNLTSRFEHMEQELDSLKERCK